MSQTQTTPTLDATALNDDDRLKIAEKAAETVVSERGVRAAGGEEEEEAGESPDEADVDPVGSERLPDDPPEEIEEARAMFFQQVSLAESRLAMLMLDEVRAEIALKECKKARKALAGCLQDLINKGPERMPLFDQNAVNEAAKADGEDEELEEGLVDPSSQDDSDDWQSVTTREAGIPEKICKILDAAERALLTVGDLSAWTDEHSDYDNPLNMIKGIGPAKAEEILDSLDKFWASREEEGEAEEGEEEDDDSEEE